MPLIFPFILGLLSAFGALFVELFYIAFTTNPNVGLLTETVFTPTLFSLFILALIEESVKILFFLRSTRLNFLPVHPLFFGLSFGVGFASLEYFALSLMGTETSGPLFGILLIHLITSILLVFLLRQLSTRRQIFVTLGILVLIHFGYNAILSTLI